MKHKRLIVTVGIGGVLTIALIAGLHILLRNAIAARLPSRVCVPMYAAEIVCYAQPETLLTRKQSAIAVDPAGVLLATGDGNIIQRWDLKTRQLLPPLVGHSNSITALAISPDGRILASSSLDRTIKLWDVQTSRLLGTMPAGRASVLVFSPDGRTLASGSRVQRWADGVEALPGVQFWDVSTQQFRYRLGERPARAIAFSQDGQLLATGDIKTEVWLVKAGELLHTLNSGDVTGLSFGQAGQTLITGSSKIKIWNLATGEPVRVMETGTSDVVVSPDGQILATTVGGTVRFWQLQSDRYLGLLRTSWYSSLFVQFALEGHAIVVGNSEGVKIWQSPEN